MMNWQIAIFCDIGSKPSQRFIKVITKNSFAVPWVLAYPMQTVPRQMISESIL